MARFGVGRTVGYRRLAALVDAGLLSRRRLVYGQPALYVATADGVAFAGLGELDPARLNEASIRHWALCARLAVVLEQRERYEVWGEPRLRAAERQAGPPAVVRARATDRLALYESADVSHQVESVRSGVGAGRGISRTKGVANWGGRWSTWVKRLAAPPARRRAAT